jgi:hypothetical protein
MSNAIERDLYVLVDKELHDANRKFPMFHSAHEGYSVLREEGEEMIEAADAVSDGLSALWDGVRGTGFYQNRTPEQRADMMHKRATQIYQSAINTAVEALQTAAMARKFIISNEQLARLDDAVPAAGAETDYNAEEGGGHE